MTEDRSLPRRIVSVLLSPPGLIMLAAIISWYKLRSHAGMTDPPELLALMVFTAVSAFTFVLWVVRLWGCRQSHDHDKEGRKRLRESVLVFRAIFIVFLAWTVISLRYATAFGGGFVYAQDKNSGNAMVPDGWSAVRLRAEPHGAVVGVKTAGFFPKPCAAGCLETVFVHSTIIDEWATLPSADGKGVNVRLKAQLRIGSNGNLFAVLAKKLANPQEAIVMAAVDDLRECAAKALANQTASASFCADLDCDSRSSLFRLTDATITN